MSITHNSSIIKEKIHEACIKSGRDSSEVKLMAVSKFHPIEEIHEAYDAGLRLFGENRVQEAVEKFCTLNLSDLELHLIGSLQRNKVKKILPLVTCIQSIDRLELLQEIAKHEDAKRVSLLLEVHTGEESKNGFKSVIDVENAIRYAATEGLHISGFMTMAPFTDDINRIRKSFIHLRETAQKMKELFHNLPLTELSMGMSNDYEIAIEEGATIVRVGTAIFGKRM